VIGEILHCDWRQLAERVKAEVGTVGCVQVDAPYSPKTHSGHDSGAASANRPVKANGVRDTGRERRSIDYAPWTDDDVCAFVDTWAPRTSGWMVSITDDILAPSWRSAYEVNGLLAFAPLPLVETGATVRLTGDGPSSWTTWVCVARPRTKEMASWGTLPGAYIVPSERKPVVGGKPLSAMEALVRDYTRPGDLVCDPCCGGGTTLIAAKLLGRRFIGGDIDAKHVEIARKRVSAITMGRPLSLNFGDVG
jgi:hypothetical protein